MDAVFISEVPDALFAMALGAEQRQAFAKTFWLRGHCQTNKQKNMKKEKQP